MMTYPECKRTGLRGEGQCGACTVLVDGTAQRSCILNVGHVAGKNVTTIEGLGTGDELHPVQQACVEHDALQCGYCTPGMVLTSVALIARKPQASEADIVAGLDANFCRCAPADASLMHQAESR